MISEWFELTLINIVELQFFLIKHPIKYLNSNALNYILYRICICLLLKKTFVLNSIIIFNFKCAFYSIKHLFFFPFFILFWKYIHSTATWQNLNAYCYFNTAIFNIDEYIDIDNLRIKFINYGFRNVIFCTLPTNIWYYFKTIKICTRR